MTAEHRRANTERLARLGPMLPAQRRRLFALTSRLGMDAAERHDFASLLLGYDGSWAALDRQQAARLIDGIEGFVAIQYLIVTRPPIPPPAHRR